MLYRSFSLFIMLLSISFSLLAEELYKGIDAAGITRYSDKPFPGGKPFLLKPIAVMPQQTLSPKNQEKASKKNVGSEYQISIISPENNQIFSHETQSIPVKLILTPKPTQKTTIRLLLNGEALPQSDTTQLLLGPLPRGSYQLQAELLDPNELNHPLATSKLTTFYQQRAFVKK